MYRRWGLALIPGLNLTRLLSTDSLLGSGFSKVESGDSWSAECTAAGPTSAASRLFPKRDAMYRLRLYAMRGLRSAFIGSGLEDASDGGLGRQMSEMLLYI